MNNPPPEVVLEAAETEIGKWGPRRVVLNTEGEAVSQEKAYRLQNEFPDVIFIRNDGWTLGAVKALVSTAEAMWPDDWIGVIVRPGTRPISYREYRRIQSGG